MIDNSDGVDYIRHSIFSEKDAPLGDFEPVDGSCRMCLDEMWHQVKKENFIDPEGCLISLYMDTYGHELFHKWAVWGMDGDLIETWNEMDERVMRVCSDWIQQGKMSKMAEYDYK